MHERILLGSLTLFVSCRGGPLRALGEVHLCAVWQDNQMEPVERALSHRPGKLKGVDALPDDEHCAFSLPGIDSASTATRLLQQQLSEET